MVFNRKRKDNRSPSFILDDSPKRTKVQAQRKFAQGSNVNSPVLTPVKEIECQERTMPEPVELLPMKRPNTEDFLTFLCFRGTPVLPSGLNFFNSASMVDSRPRNPDSPSTSPKNGLIFPSAISKTQGERPFIAFGVRKRADPIVVSRHMDKKRRHALALQALRRKYQEQKMAKIRAITISKLSEKVQTNKTVVRTTRCITKSDHTVTKKNMASKTKITVVSTKRVKVTTRRTSTLKPARGKVNVKVNVNKQKQKMCLRSYRGRFVQRELVNKPVKKRAVKQSKNAKGEDGEDDEEEDDDDNEEESVEEEEFSSDDDQPLLKKGVKTKKVINKKPEMNHRFTRSNQIITRRVPKTQSRILVRGTAANLKSPPNSPRLRSQLKRELKVVKQEVVKSTPMKKKHLITKKIDLKRKVLRGGKIREVEIKKTIRNDNKTTSEEKSEEKRITRDAQRKIDDDDKKVTKVEDDKKKVTKKVTKVEIKVTKDAKKKVQPVKKVIAKNKTPVKKAERKSKEEMSVDSSSEEEEENKKAEEEKKPVRNKKVAEQDKKEVATKSKNEENEKKNVPTAKSKVDEKKRTSIKGKKSIDVDETKGDAKKKPVAKGKKAVNQDGDDDKKAMNDDNSEEKKKATGKVNKADDNDKKKTNVKGKKPVDDADDDNEKKKVTTRSKNDQDDNSIPDEAAKNTSEVTTRSKNDEKKSAAKGKKAVETEDESGKKKIIAKNKQITPKAKVQAKGKKGKAVEAEKKTETEEKGRVSRRSSQGVVEPEGEETKKSARIKTQNANKSKDKNVDGGESDDDEKSSKKSMKKGEEKVPTKKVIKPKEQKDNLKEKLIDCERTESVDQPKKIVDDVKVEEPKSCTKPEDKPKNIDEDESKTVEEGKSKTVKVDKSKTIVEDKSNTIEEDKSNKTEADKTNNIDEGTLNMIKEDTSKLFEKDKSEAIVDDSKTTVENKSELIVEDKSKTTVEVKSKMIVENISTTIVEDKSKMIVESQPQTESTAANNEIGNETKILNKPKNTTTDKTNTQPIAEEEDDNTQSTQVDSEDTYCLFEDLNAGLVDNLVNQSEKNGLLSLEEKNEIEDKLSICGVKKVKTYSNKKKSLAKADEVVPEEKVCMKIEEKPLEVKIKIDEVKLHESIELKTVAKCEGFSVGIEAFTNKIECSPNKRDSIEDDGSPKTSKFDVDLMKKAANFTLKIDHSEKTFEDENRLSTMFGDSEHDSDDEDTALKICSDEENDDFEDKRRNSIDMKNEEGKTADDSEKNKEESLWKNTECVIKKENSAFSLIVKPAEAMRLKSASDHSNMFGIISNLKKIEELSHLKTPITSSHTNTESLIVKQSEGISSTARSADEFSSTRNIVPINMLPSNFINVSGLPTHLRPIVAPHAIRLNQKTAEPKLASNLNKPVSSANVHPFLILNQPSIPLQANKHVISIDIQPQVKVSVENPSRSLNNFEIKKYDQVTITPQAKITEAAIMKKNEAMKVLPFTLVNKTVPASKIEDKHIDKVNAFILKDIEVTSMKTIEPTTTQITRDSVNITLVKKVDACDVPLMRKVDPPLIKKVETSLLMKVDTPLMKKVDTPLINIIDTPLMKKVDCDSANTLAIKKICALNTSGIHTTKLEPSPLKKIESLLASSAVNVSSNEVDASRKVQQFQTYPVVTKKIEPEVRKVERTIRNDEPQLKKDELQMKKDELEMKRVGVDALLSLHKQKVEMSLQANSEMLLQKASEELYVKRVVSGDLLGNGTNVQKGSIAGLREVKAIAQPLIVNSDEVRKTLVERLEDTKRVLSDGLKSSVEVVKKADLNAKVAILDETGFQGFEKSVGDLSKSKADIESQRMDAMISEMAKELAAQDAQTGPRMIMQKQKKVVVKKAKPVQDLPKRPSRKTKEAAAVYMEILGHKLENEDADDVSIDSFPELPNVKKMEQRENELKASLLQKRREKRNARSDSDDSFSSQTQKGSVKKREKKRKGAKGAATSDSDESFTAEIKTPPEKRTRQTRKHSPKLYKSFSDTDSESDLIPIKQALVKRKSDADNNEKKTKKPRMESETANSKSALDEDSLDKELKKKVNESDAKKAKPKAKRQDASETEDELKSKKPKANKNTKEETSDADASDKKKQDSLKKGTKNKAKLSGEGSSEESDDEVLQKKVGKRNPGKKKKKARLDDQSSFGESDEEPLVKLKKKPQEETGKQRRECTKKPQNYLPLFSSSEDEEKYFHGFVKTESPPKPPKIMKIMKREDPIDLLSTKDLGRRYGKEKVNMSNEQIEKWLNDSAMAGMSLIKKENDEMLKFGEKIPTETSLETLSLINTDGLKNSLLLLQPTTALAKLDSKEKVLSSPSVTPEKYASISPSRPLPKTIFRKEKSEPLKNANAFSVCNESSVYAFEADEDLINTPFRRPSRRPSSTATSKSEDDLGVAREHEQKLSKFRHPNLMCNKSGGKDASSLNISTDESNNSGSLTQKSVPKSLEKTNKPLAASTPMCPPTQTTLQKAKENRSSARSCSKSLDRASDAASEEFKYKIPSSPSASSSSSAKLYKRNIKKSKTAENYTAVNVTEFPAASDSVSRIVEAPVFHPTDKEFVDPMEYIEKIRAKAEKFGICRIVPPANFKPECKVLDEMRFTAYNQYVHKMMHRWGPNFRELVAIRKYLATQSISLKHPPWIGGMEIDLPRLYQTVQTLGGLKEVIEKKKWPKVSELMKIPKSAQDRVTKLDDIYCKYLLPYDTLSPDERDKLFDSVETDWAKRESKNLLKVQQSNTEEEEVKSDEEESEDEDETDIECIVKGRSMALNTFYRIARNSMAMWFKNSEPDAQEVEEEFWKHVTTKKYHICVHSGSIDSGNWGYGFAVSKNSPFARHAWNLKVLTNNSGSLLRSMGPVMGLTVPTLHVGMVFSGCCWYRDPHSLPWIEYLHTGANKIWYGIPDSMSEKFHTTLLNLVPNYCLNKSIWLPSDTVMLPPELLVDNGVSLTRTVQKPGEFVVIFPKAFTSNICTGYVVSESVFFAPPHWLNTAEVVFDELKDSCEPSMFSYERLLLSVANDSRSDVNVLKQIVPAVWKLCEREKQLRAEVKGLGVVEEERLPVPDNKKKKKMQESEIEYACEDCRRNLFCSMVFDSQENGIYCMEHAMKHLRANNLEAGKCRIMFTYDVPELDVLVKNLNSTIEAKLQKKSAGNRHYSLPTMVSL